MMKNQKGIAHLLLLLAVIVIAIICFVAYSVRVHTAESIENKGYTYLFNVSGFGLADKNGIQALVSKDRSLLISATPSSTNKQLTCTTKVPKIYDVQINGTSYPLCKFNGAEIYAVTFKDGTQWHSITVLSPQEHYRTISVPEIQNLVQHIKVIT